MYITAIKVLTTELLNPDTSTSSRSFYNQGREAAIFIFHEFFFLQHHERLLFGNRMILAQNVSVPLKEIELLFFYINFFFFHLIFFNLKNIYIRIYIFIFVSPSVTAVYIAVVAIAHLFRLTSNGNE